MDLTKWLKYSKQNPYQMHGINGIIKQNKTKQNKTRPGEKKLWLCTQQLEPTRKQTQLNWRE